MNLYTQQNTTEDQVLDNYVALWRHINGDRKLFVRKQVQKEIQARNCKMCGVEFKPKSPKVQHCVACVPKTRSIAGKIGGKKAQQIVRYKRLKEIWEQED